MERNPKGAGSSLEKFPWNCPKCDTLYWYRLNDPVPTTLCCLNVPDDEDITDAFHASPLDRWWRLVKQAGVRTGRRSCIKQIMTLPAIAKENELYLRIFRLLNKMLPERLRVEEDVTEEGEAFPSMPAWSINTQQVADVVIGAKFSFRVDADTACPVLRIEGLSKDADMAREIWFTASGELEKATTL